MCIAFHKTVAPTFRGFDSLAISNLCVTDFALRQMTFVETRYYLGINFSVIHTSSSFWILGKAARWKRWAHLYSGIVWQKFMLCFPSVHSTFMFCKLFTSSLVSMDNSMCNYTQFKSSIVWRPSAGENAEQGYNSPTDKFSVKVIKKTVKRLAFCLKSSPRYLGISCMWWKDMGQSDWPQAASWRNGDSLSFLVEVKWKLMLERTLGEQEVQMKASR